MTNEVPVSGRDFVVRVTRRGPRGGVRDEFDLACSQVILPVLLVGERRLPPIGRVDPAGRRGRPAGDREDGPDAEHADDEALVLRRGHTGSTELSDWWAHEREALLPGSHDVDVTALDRSGNAVTTWTFTGCRLVALSYSPLDALDSNVLAESAEISFDEVTLTAGQ